MTSSAAQVPKAKLFDYPRSSASYRVRIALALKGIPADLELIHLLRNGGEQHSAAYRAVNPQGLVPALEIDGQLLTQTLAIIEYLDERYPEPALLPRDAVARAKVRALALSVAADIHPLQNSRVGKHLKQEYAASDDQVTAWNRRWIQIGLEAFQAMLPAGGTYSWGNTVTLADIFLAPQMVNARRYACDFASLGRLVAIDTALQAMPAFADTAPTAAP